MSEYGYVKGDKRQSSSSQSVRKPDVSARQAAPRQASSPGRDRGIEKIPPAARAVSGTYARPKIEPPVKVNRHRATPTGLAARREAGLSPADLQAFLQVNPIFKVIDGGLLLQVAGYFKHYIYPAGAEIVKAGAAADTIGLVYRGAISLNRVDAASGNKQAVGALKPGDLFGEVGALLGGAHQHTVIAEQESTVLELKRDLLLRLCQKIPGVGLSLASRMAAEVTKLSVLAMRPMAPATAATGSLDLRLPEGFEGIPFVEISDFNVTEQLLNLVPFRVIQQHRIVPLSLDGRTLTIGMVSPHDRAALAEIKRMLQSVDIRPAGISIDDFSASLIKLKPSASSAVGRGNSRNRVEPTLTFDLDDAERDAEKEIRVMGDEVIRLANRVISEGLMRGASDIHIGSDRAGVKVQYRVSGGMQESNESIPGSFSKGLVARIKVLAGLDITERRLPQDGRIGMTVNRQEVDLRVSTVPAARGEKVVLRICEASSVLRDLNKMFVDKPTLDRVREALNLHSGAVVVAGGTGSGKSSTMYSMLNERMRTRPGTNVVMIEDPIEFRMQGVTQVQVNTAVGLDFPQVLRATLRQDPDVIVVGETRDQETAQLALEASISGHLLLTSVHANNALATLQRLESLGCGRSIIAQGMSLILVQRLAPKLCSNCVRSDVAPPLLADSLAKHGLLERGSTIRVPFPGGCAACSKTGYDGRVAIVETLQVDEQIKALLMSEKSFAEIKEYAERSRLYSPFRRYAALLMEHRMLSAADAMMAIG